MLEKIAKREPLQSPPFDTTMCHLPGPPIAALALAAAAGEDRLASYHCRRTAAAQASAGGAAPVRKSTPKWRRSAFYSQGLEGLSKDNPGTEKHPEEAPLIV